MHFFHYPGWLAWFGEEPAVRARLIAHMQERNAREAYEFAASKKPEGSGAKKPEQENGWSAFKSRVTSTPFPR